jgi:transcriptional regulator with XRE-family HTH domain
VEFGQAFGQVFKAHRKAGFSHEELAHRACIHSTAISLYERGLRQPTLHTVFNLSRVLGLQPSQIVSEVEALSPRLG